jgi:hypothetical protein
VRPARLERATSWFVAGRRESTRGSGTPLPQCFRAFSITRGYSRAPRAATDCLPFVSQFRAAATPPVTFLRTPPRLPTRRRRYTGKQADAMTTKDTVRAILDRLPDNCTIECCIRCTSFRPSSVATRRRDRLDSVARAGRRRPAPQMAAGRRSVIWAESAGLPSRTSAPTSPGTHVRPQSGPPCRTRHRQLTRSGRRAA